MNRHSGLKKSGGARAQGARTPPLWLKMWKIRLLYVMVAPAVGYFLLFQYGPMYGVLIAFQEYSPFRGMSGSEWVGFKHFADLFADPYFYKLLRNTVLLSLYTLLFGFPVPIVFALLLNEVRFSFLKRSVQTLSFFPYFVSSAVAVGMLYLFLSYDGLVNQFLASLFHMEAIFFLFEPNYFRSLYVLLDIWKSFGYAAIIYLAAITAIDPHLYEAAEVDGAGRLRKMWSITLPGLSNTIIILFILAMGGMLSVSFETVLLMYNPSIYETADVIQTYTYRRAFPIQGFPNYSYATAVNLFQSVVALMLIVLVNYLSKKYSETYLF